MFGDCSNGGIAQGTRYSWYFDECVALDNKGQELLSLRTQ